MEHTTEDIFCSTPRLQEIKKHVNIVKSSEEIGGNMVNGKKNS